MALHEMGRLNPEVLNVAQEWGDGLQPEGEPPQDVLTDATEESAGEHQQRRRQVESAEPKDGLHRGRDTGPGEQARMHDGHDQVAEAEGQAGSTEGAGNGKRDQQEARHTDHQQ